MSQLGKQGLNIMMHIGNRAKDHVKCKLMAMKILLDNLQGKSSKNMRKMRNKTTNGLKHGWGTQNDCLILYLLDPSLKHVVEI